MEHTLGADQPTIRVLAKAHTTRNAAEYEGYFEADEQLVKDLLAAAEWVAAVRVMVDADFRRRLGANGRRQVEDGYSVIAGGEAWVEVLGRLAGANRRAG